MIRFCITIAVFTLAFSMHAKPANIIFLPGKDSHSDGAHEFRAGCHLLAKKLEQSGLDLNVTVLEEDKWPSSNRQFEKADAIIVYSDGRHKHRLADDDRFPYFVELAKQGKNVAFMHYACEVEEENSHYLMDMMGACYIKGESTNPHWTLSSILNKDHAITRGVQSFKVKDEWYFNIRFSDQLGHTPILQGIPDDEARSGKTSSPRGALKHVVAASGRKETTMWAVERPDGGRAFGFTGGHFHHNWANDEYRKLVLNSIVWLAGMDVPKNGVASATPTKKELHHLTKKHVAEMADYKKSQTTHLAPSAFELPDDLELTVWAKSPQLKNPTNMDVDAKGRVWVTEGVNYRSHSEREKAGDRIVVLRDSDADGKADNSQVFYQGRELIAPLGIAVLGNEIFVSQPPDLLKFTDVDEDGVFTPGTDKKEVFLTGFGGANHDHSLHALSAGPDGYLYFNTGNAGGFAVTDKSGKTIRGSSWYAKGRPIEASDDGHTYVGGALFRVRPDGSGLQVVAHNFRNAYEHVMTSAGDVFQADNDDTESCRTSWVMEGGNAGFASADGKRSWRADRRPGQPLPQAHWRQADPGVMPAGDIYGTGAPTGVEFYENGALPAKYRGLLIVCESARNTLYGYYPKPDRAGFSLQRFDLLTSNARKTLSGTDFHGRKEVGEVNTWFRPSDVCVGPDGAIYIADWFDSRVGGHQSLDDRMTGTIYRLAPKGFKPAVPTHDLRQISGAIAALRSPAKNVRHTGFAALVNFGEAAFPAVQKLLKDDDSFIRHRALWLLPRLGEEGKSITRKYLQDAEPQTAIVAIRALRRVGELSLEHAAHPAPAVRREIAYGLRDESFSSAKSAILALAKGYDGVDRYYLEAFGTACTSKEAEVFAYLQQQLGQSDALTWTDAFASIAWRLHPESAINAFTVRALADLPLASREQAVDGLAFIKSKAAADAMIQVAHKCNDDLLPLVMHWLKNRKSNDWKVHNLGRAINQINRTVPEVTAVEAPTFRVDHLQLSAGGKAGRDLFFGRGTCFVCHKFGDKGRDVGPNLSMIGATYSSTVIKEAIVNPSSAIVFGYELTTVKTKAGAELQGFLVVDGDPLILTDISGARHEIALADVAGKQTTQRSLMPSAEMLGLKDKDLDAIARFLVEAGSQPAAQGFTDNFAPTHQRRRAARGTWRFADEIAGAKHDDATYKAHKNHGPVLWYSYGCQDATIRFEMKCEDVRSVEFTVKGNAQKLFRFSIDESATHLRAWNKGAKAATPLGRGDGKLRSGAWIPVELHMAGDTATVQVGDAAPKVVTAAGIGAAKDTFGITFHHGGFQLRNVSLKKE